MGLTLTILFVIIGTKTDIADVINVKTSMKNALPKKILTENHIFEIYIKTTQISDNYTTSLSIIDLWGYG